MSCAHLLSQRFDEASGGFGNAPKFPRPAELNALLANHQRGQDPTDDSSDSCELIVIITGSELARYEIMCSLNRDPISWCRTVVATKYMLVPLSESRGQPAECQLLEWAVLYYRRNPHNAMQVRGDTDICWEGRHRSQPTHGGADPGQNGCWRNPRPRWCAPALLFTALT